MSRRVLFGGVLYAAAMLALGVLASWPIYQSLAVLWVALAAAVVGGVLAGLSQRFRWPGWLALIALLAAWFALGVALAIPARWASGNAFPAGLLDVALGPITGWKDLATVPLPVGEYRNLLVPLLVLVLVSVFAGLRLAWRSAWSFVLAVPVLALMPFFGLVFGRTATSAPIMLGPFRLSAPIETATGAAALLVSVLWLAWRARNARQEALRRAESSTGIRASANAPGAAARRVALAAGMVVVALAAGVAVTPTVADARTREVIRSSLGPDLSKLLATSPLAQYRASFTDARYGQTLFQITADGAMPERIRLATLTSYDGEVYRAAAGADDAFRRVPAQIDAGAGAPASATIEIDALRGNWLPTVGNLARVDFEGADATTLADGFYYDAATGSGVEARGLGQGDRYWVSAVIPDAPSLAEARGPGRADKVELPKNMKRWLDDLGVSASGTGVQEAITALRERGYLSHALSIDTATPPKWMQPLGDYTFRPSAAGHSLARIDKLFQQLLERQEQAALLGPNASLVGAVGDDEQFAVAGALIARSLGFPARVVLGFRTADPKLPSCTEGVCRAGDLAAWIEVSTAPGAWVAVDTTPQHTENPTTDTRRERDPENATDVRPDTAREVAPPDPQRQEANDTPPLPPAGPDLSSLWAVVRIAGISLAGLIILLAPFLAVLFAKASRRRGRRRDTDPARAIAGGWEEYVDAAVDAGRPAPRTQTRQELAAVYATPRSSELAGRADHAVFGGAALTADETTAFWDIVNSERDALHAENGWWKRLRSALSLKSFTRQLAVRTTRSARSAGRVPPRGGSAAPAARD